MSLESLKPLGIGAAGFLSSTGVQTAQAVEAVPISETVGIISQIVILVATLIGLFRKNKDGKNQK